MTSIQVTDEKMHVQHFIGKTISRMCASTQNIAFWFTDGSKMELHIDCMGDGLPDINICNTCIDENVTDHVDCSQDKCNFIEK